MLQINKLVIGQTLEIGTSTKGSVTAKANYYRLTSERKVIGAGAYLITSSKDKVRFCGSSARDNR